MVFTGKSLNLSRRGTLQQLVKTSCGRLTCNPERQRENDKGFRCWMLAMLGCVDTMYCAEPKIRYETDMVSGWFGRPKIVNFLYCYPNNVSWRTKGTCIGLGTCSATNLFITILVSWIRIAISGKYCSAECTLGIGALMPSGVTT